MIHGGVYQTLIGMCCGVSSKQQLLRAGKILIGTMQLPVASTLGDIPRKQSRVTTDKSLDPAVDD